MASATAFTSMSDDAGTSAELSDAEEAAADEDSEDEATDDDDADADDDESLFDELSEPHPLNTSVARITAAASFLIFIISFSPFIHFYSGDAVRPRNINMLLLTFSGFLLQALRHCAAEEIAEVIRIRLKL